MTITVIDDQTTLNGTELELHEMAATLTGTTYLSRILTSDTLGGIKALGTQRIIVADIDADPDDEENDFDIETQLTALALAGAGSSVINEGAIKSETAAAILFSGGGTSMVTNAAGKKITGAKGIEISSTSTSARLDLLNAGIIEATVAANAAIIGGLGADRIVNTGIIRATSADGVALKLGDGDDLYDGRNGTAIGLIELGKGRNIAYGGSGDERFSVGVSSSNVIDGGAGINDMIDYSAVAATNDEGRGVTVNLGNTVSQWTNHSSDTLLNIEHIIGSAFNDALTGNSDKNRLVGGGGDDTLDGGFNDDTLDGGAGNNTAKFSSSTAAKVDLSITVAQATGYGNDTLINIRNLEGGTGADEFIGNGEANRLNGAVGNDTLIGAAGDDTLIGGSGNDSLKGGADNDTLQGDAGDDTLEGGAGNDVLEGGTGKNTAVFSGSWSEYDIVSGAGGFTITDRLGRDGTDTLKDIRFAKFADKTVALVNGAPSNISPSVSPINVSESRAVGSQVTTLFSSDPDGDTLTYSLVTNPGGLFALDGNKLILVGALDYETATKHTISVMVSDGWGGSFVKELTINVTNSTTETNPLVKRGTNASEQIVGENGNDRLYGQGGNDQIFGQGGNDTLWGGKGNDTLAGGAGKDVFVFDTRPHARSNLDYVLDFNVKDDTIHLSKKVFSKLAKKGTLAKGAFVVGDHFKDGNDRILYHKKAGALFYDPDGTGPAKAVQFATIGKNLKITHKDFYVI